MNWRTVALIGVCAVLIASYGVLTNNKDNDEQSGEAPPQPGYYVKQATVIDTNDQGVAYLQLSAETIEQNPATNSVELRDVKLDYSSEPDKPWVLTARRGRVPPGSRIAEFSGDVVVKPGGPSKTPAILRTEFLRVDTEKNVASTTADVSIEMNQQRLTATGFTFDLKQERLRLESKVNGRFQFNK